jgi:hypothetical protein
MRVLDVAFHDWGSRRSPNASCATQPLGRFDVLRRKDLAPAATSPR